MISVFWLLYYPEAPITKAALKKKLISKDDIEKIKRGGRITDGTIHDGGSMKNPERFYAIQFMFNYLPFLPKRLVSFLIKSGWYKIFKVRNYYIATLLPRFIRSIIDKRYFWGRGVIVSIFNPKTIPAAKGRTASTCRRVRFGANVIDKNTFSPKKIANRLRLLRDFLGRKEKTKGLPLEIGIEITNICNFACIMCPYQDMVKKKIRRQGKMSFSLFKKIVDEISSFAELIYLHGLGEPLLHPQLFKFIGHAKSKGLRD